MTKNLVIKKSHLLPWEDTDEYELLAAALHDEYEPQGPTERHLVDELAGIIWRRNRIGMAETALHQYGLNISLQSQSRTGERALAHVGGGKPGMDMSDVMQVPVEEIPDQLADVQEALEMMEKAQALAEGGKYEVALEALRDDTREWWQDILLDEEDAMGHPREATAESLFSWLCLEALPYVRNTIHGLTHAENIQNQAYGESLNPAKFNELARWEAHLDRRMERTISLLMKLRNTRKAGTAA